MNRWVTFACMWSGLLLGHAATASADWPEFRGPTGQGVYQGTEPLPLRWSRTERVQWRQPLSGEGWSSPTVVAGRIYLTAAAPVEGGRDLALQTMCLSAATGKPVWATEVFRQNSGAAPRIHRKNSHASPTPIVSGGKIYVHFGHQGTACLDTDGKIVWKRKIDYRPVHGNGGSPILVNGQLIFSVDGAGSTYVVALDAASGEQRWKHDRQSTAARKFSFNTPLAIKVGNQTQVVSAGSDMVLGLDAATGKRIWKVVYDGYSVIPRPVYGNGLVYVCTGYNRPSLLAIDPTGTGDVTDSHVRWQTNRSVPHTPSLLLSGDELYMVSDRGLASCLDARTGEVHWQERLNTTFSASPLLAGKRIYLQGEEGEGIVLATGTTFRELARNDLGERTLASYAVDGKALLIRSAEHLYRIE